MIYGLYDEGPLYMIEKFTKEQIKRYIELCCIETDKYTEEQKKELQELYEYGNTPPESK